eukprot:gene2599-5085_t
MSVLIIKTLVGVLFVSFVVSQESAIYQIPLTIDGQNYVVNHADDFSITNSATLFCRANANSLGVTNESLMGCVTPVANYLSDRVTQLKTEEKPATTTPAEMISVTLNIRGTPFEIRSQKDSASVANAANAFCRENASAFGLTESTISLDCIEPVIQYLNQYIQTRKSAEGVAQTTTTTPAANEVTEISIPLVVNENQFSLRFNPNVVSSTAMATTFCREQGQALGVTAESMGGCVTGVSTYLQQVLDQRMTAAPALPEAEAPAPVVSEALGGPVRVTLNIADKDYDITFQPSIVTTDAAATSFCRQEGAAFGITQETLGGCVRSVSDFLAQALATRTDQVATTPAPPAPAATTTAATTSPALKVTLNIQGRDFDISFRPDVTTAGDAAVQFCREQSGTFGLTEATMSVCVLEISQNLARAVTRSKEDALSA